MGQPLANGNLSRGGSHSSLGSMGLAGVPAAAGVPPAGSTNSGLLPSATAPGLGGLGASSGSYGALPALAGGGGSGSAAAGLGGVVGMHQHQYQPPSAAGLFGSSMPGSLPGSGPPSTTSGALSFIQAHAEGSQRAAANMKLLQAHIDELTAEKLELMRGLQQQAKAAEALAEENRALGEQLNALSGKQGAGQDEIKRLQVGWWVEDKQKGGGCVCGGGGDVNNEQAVGEEQKRSEGRCGQQQCLRSCAAVLGLHVQSPACKLRMHVCGLVCSMQAEMAAAAATVAALSGQQEAHRVATEEAVQRANVSSVGGVVLGTSLFRIV